MPYNQMKGAVYHAHHAMRMLILHLPHDRGILPVWELFSHTAIVRDRESSEE